ncbi:MAG: hypothetical protein KBS97_02535 [Firmicutes bacterium]|nr:hypothetical protein [Candidatus Fiminaster equi]
MKTTKVLLLSLGMALCVGGGIGAAVAITRQAAGNTGSSAFDKAVNLYWVEGSSSIELGDMETLSVNVPQYRYLTVSPKSSASVSGNVELGFTLAEATIAEKTAVLKGLTVSVYKTAFLATDATVASLIDGKTPEPVLNATTKTGTTSFAAKADSADAVAYYAIQVVYDGSQIGATEQLAATLTIAQSFVIPA